MLFSIVFKDTDFYFVIQEKHYPYFEQYYIAFALKANIYLFNNLSFNICFLLLKQQM